MEKIKRISEAYSMQPYYKEVTFGKKYDFELRDGIISEIKKVDEFYIGYDKNGSKLFAWRADAVNIEYFKQGEYVEPTIKGDDDLPNDLPI